MYVEQKYIKAEMILEESNILINIEIFGKQTMKRGKKTKKNRV